MITGAVIAVVSVFTGLLLGRFLPARRKGPKPVRPICGCHHHASMHDPQTGRCHDNVYLGFDENLVGRHGQCPCRKYTGPEPLPEFYAPEIGG